jgi:hypothetical protein
LWLQGGFVLSDNLLSGQPPRYLRGPQRRI